MVWMSSLSTAVAEVWPAVGFRLVALSPSLSVLLDSVRMSWGDNGGKGRRALGRKVASSSCFYLGFGKLGYGNCMMMIRCWRTRWKSQDQRIRNLTDSHPSELLEERLLHVPLLGLNKREGTHIGIWLSRSHKSPALGHRSFTRWSAKPFRLHRKIVSIILRAFSNSDGKGKEWEGSSYCLFLL